MTIDELKALFQELEKQGLNPMLCDREIPMYDASVPCGNPTICSGESVDMASFPKELLSIQPEFMVSVKGDSMKDVGITTGDMVKVMADTTPYDGDIVLAYIDGECTLKTYCEDEDGQIWLVPQNEAYHPILLDGKMNVRIFGTVKEIVKRAPRVAYKQCIRAIRKERTAAVKAQQISKRRIRFAIREIAPNVVIGRQWYAVYRAMADLKVVTENDYEQFCTMVKDEVPEHEHLPVRDEIQRLAMLSFAKPVNLWREDNAPVQGKRFNDYLCLAQEMKRLLIA